MNTAETPARDTPTLGSVVNRIAGLLAHGGGVLSAGDVAALRRMDPHNPAAAFFKIAGLILEDQLPGQVSARQEYETRWSAVIVGLAYLGELHRPGMNFGQALVAAGFSELRFSRLLRADGDRLIDELPMLARFLAAKGVPADWVQPAWLILSADRTDEETTRRNLARDYYRALARKSNT